MPYFRLQMIRVHALKRLDLKLHVITIMARYADTAVTMGTNQLSPAVLSRATLDHGITRTLVRK